MVHLAILAAALVPAVATAATPAGPAPRRTGAVIQVTPSRAYLDAGSADGLVAGMTLELRRRGAPAGSCTVEHVAPSHATCRGDAARPGDLFPLPAATAARPASLEAAPPPAIHLSAEERARRQEALAAAPQQLSEYRGPVQSGIGRKWKAEAELGHASWIAIDSDDGTFHRESVSVSIAGAELGAGFRLWADATAVAWTRRPDDVRFRPDADTQLYVHRAEIASREGDRAWVLAAGRIWPWHAPGVTLFDGVQAGFRPAPDVEVGLFGGGIPTTEAIEPSFDSWTAGAYGAWTRAEEGPVFPWLRLEGQLSVVEIGDEPASIPDADDDLLDLTRFEAAGRARTSIVDGLDAGGELRAILGGDVDAGLSGARLDLGARPADDLRLALDYRWLDREALAIAAWGTPLLLVSSRRADAVVAWDAARWITVAAVGGLTVDVEDDLARRWLGPEVTFPRALGGRGSVGVGYQEEVGWLEGRMAWVQTSALPWDRLQLLARLSYLETVADLEEAEPLREAGAWLSARARLLDWLTLDASLLGRVTIETEENASVPAGVFARVGLRGQL